MWTNLPDIATYFEIFDDYLDFKIYPWDSTGYDDGEMIPERKNALRLLLTGIQAFKHQQQQQKRGGGGDSSLVAQQTQQQQQQDPAIFGKVVETKGEAIRGGKKYELTGREVTMRAPQKEDLENWDWKKFAYEDDIKAYEKLKKEGRV